MFWELIWYTYAMEFVQWGLGKGGCYKDGVRHNPPWEGFNLRACTDVCKEKKSFIKNWKNVPSRYANVMDYTWCYLDESE